jgi:hypothetical protein
MAVAYCHHRAANRAPPLGGDVISPARIVANVLDETFVGGKEEGGGDGGGVIERYNNDNDNVGL